MKRFTLALVAVVFLSAGTASADRGWWFGGGTGGTAAWTTVMNITNYDASASSITVTFYDITNSLIGSTVQSINSNETWNFSTSTVGTINASSFDSTAGGSTRGAIKITGGTDVVGYTTIFNSTSFSGFNFRIPN